MKIGFEKLGLLAIICSFVTNGINPVDLRRGGDGSGDISLEEITSSFNKGSCYVKGDHIGSGRYSNVYLSWKVAHCPIENLGREGKEGTIIIDLGRREVPEQDVSILEGTPVAIKELKSVNEWKIVREATILKRLNSENGSNARGRDSIIRLLDVVSYQNTGARINGERSYALVMEYVRNEQFYSLLPRLRYEDLQNYMRQLLEGIEYANSLGIFHRDIKPQNIIVDDMRKRLKIIDWGLADYYYEEGDYSPRVASKHYKAPELLLGVRNYDYTVDTWSIGCLFSQMVFRLGTSKSNYFSRMFKVHPKNFVGIYAENSPYPDALLPGWDNEDQIVKIGSLFGGDNVLALSRKYRGTIPREALDNLMRTKKIYNTTKPWYTDQRTFYFLINEENINLVTLEALDLLSKMLTLDYKYRVKPEEALRHPFFTVDHSQHARFGGKGMFRLGEWIREDPALFVGHCNLDKFSFIFPRSECLGSQSETGDSLFSETSRQHNPPYMSQLGL